MNIEESDAKRRGYGNYAVTIIDNIMIPMRDGTRLSAKFWFPQINVSGFKEAKQYVFYKPTDLAVDKDYPTVLEYIPYRKNDYTAERDHLRYPWMASHGYVMLRVDMRGSGDSEGLYFDEYLLQEQEDCLDVLKWVAQQSWSSKAVGMYGKSWGGFNGLQVAYHQPVELKAVISLYSTDDRYASDSPHDGGCQTGDGMISWASYMFGWNARAPDPKVTSNWKAVWLDRLENASAPWGPTWLSHELRDDYWKHASICEDYSKITCPVLAIGGWKDSYTEAVFRMVEHLPTVRAIVGPWPHEWPDKCFPGPNIEYLQVCLQWWDHHLKGKSNGAMSEPKFRLYLQDRTSSSVPVENRPGRWVCTNGWPDNSSISTKQYVINPNTLQELCTSSEKQPDERWRRVPFSLRCGQDHGEWLNFGCETGPSDQRAADGNSLAILSNPLEKDLPILGLPQIHCVAKVLNHDRGMLAARLVHVAPCGESTMITHGYLNLTHRDGHGPGQVKLLEKNKEYSIMMQLHGASYVIPKGHQLRLSLSACYWPGTWPSSKAVHMEILNGYRNGQPASMLYIPTAMDDIKLYSNPLFETTDAKISTALPFEYKTEPKDETYSVHDQMKRTLTKTIVHDGGCKFYPTLGVIMQHKFKEIFEITGNDPLSARAFTEHENSHEYPETRNDKGEAIRIRIHTHSELRADEVKFYYKNKLHCYLNNETFYNKEWNDEIERKFI